MNNLKNKYLITKIWLEMKTWLSHHVNSDNECTVRKKCPYSELFWSSFSRIWPKYGEYLSIFSPNAGKCRLVKLYESFKNIILCWKKVIWDYQAFKESMPKAFCETYPSMCISINYKKLFCQVLSNLSVQSSLFSHNKHCVTNKWLAEMSPFCIIIFVTKLHDHPTKILILLTVVEFY